MVLVDLTTLDLRGGDGMATPSPVQSNLSFQAEKWDVAEVGGRMGGG